MHKTAVRIIAIILALVLLGGIILSAISALAVTQAEIDELKRQKDTITKKQAEIQAEINSLQYEQLSAISKKEVLDEQISLTEQKIDVLNQQIVEYEALIAQKKKEAEEYQKKQDERFELYKKRIRTMEENGTISYCAILFEAKTFSDLISRVDFISEIMRYDERVYNDYLKSKQDTLAAKERIETEKRAQEEVRQSVEEEKIVLQQQVAEAQKVIAEIENNIGKYREQYDEMERREKETQDEIERLIADLQKQEKISGTTVKSTGTYIWPSESSKTVTSEFGTRWHPVYQMYKTHTGVDIGADYGTSILASDSGTVVTSTYSSSYGNYVMINHGGGRTTLYAHMSKRLVSVGDSVSQGDVIGLVGSTGVSTGNHIHFEVTEDGTRVNPLKYFTDYVIKE